MVTIYDIAKQTGLSPTTISKVLNNYHDVSEKTKAKVLQAAKEMGYLPNSSARTLTTKRSWTLGILFVESTGMGIRHPFFNAVIESFKSEAESRGYDLMFISKDIGGKETSYLEHCRYRSVDGVIVILLDPRNPGMQELLDSDIPCVLLDCESTKAGTVYSDNLNGGYQAIQYLQGLGHRKIAHISGGSYYFAGQQRQLGYELALQRLKLNKRPDYIIEGGDYTLESGYEAMLELLALEDPPTAVFAAGDNLAIGAMKALKEKGLRVPEDVSIIGFDDIELASYVTPALTTIRQDTKLLGTKAAEILIESIESVRSIVNIVLPVELVIRESCKEL
ncbi:LacI family DNA-binding transcriptional regulator [Paenibacillus sp. MMS18-CY102]|uniref:LacI family DNA-binding transcriptional regulator n=1 Tax=Paenibacillus sp. MMS18-CY102 TaxID=2682849 RepID=UPI001365588B|nr:LacI family DNA-binding transcriptional regulator [Paenibacillus sp. MMS18-CY102]MWC29148.1 substrate-binding domain-containing protein [Paenibacillus sp. MMS18-CY102]